MEIIELNAIFEIKNSLVKLTIMITVEEKMSELKKLIIETI